MRRRRRQAPSVLLVVALADYQHVREICPECLIGWSTADALEKLKRPCEAISPRVQSLVHHPDLRNREEIAGRIARLSELPECSARSGQGHLALPLPGGHGYADGGIEGARFSCIVDTGATSVAISRKDAVRAGWAGRPALQVEIGTANGLVKGTQIIADVVEVGPLRAEKVPVVILPNLEGPALLGMSFLSRFDVHIDAHSLELRAR